MKIKSKKGSYVLEAALVFPVVILICLTLILISIFFYNQMVTQCRLHAVLRNEAGRISGTTIYMSEAVNDGIDAEIYIGNKSAAKTVYGKRYLVMEHKGVLKRKGTFVIEGSKYVPNGTEYVRLSSIVRGKQNE